MNIKILFLIAFATFLASFAVADLHAQGCVAIRGLSACGGNIGAAALLPVGSFELGTNFRYFRSFRHYRGSHEETHRVEQGTEVINNSYFLDFSVSYGITDRLYANAIIPFVYHQRTSMYEHGGNPPNGLGQRHATSSQGLSDIRLSVGYWLFDTEKHPHHNVAAGIGVKFPTGNYKYTDNFYNQGPDRSETRELVVDQSIQPGDGGTGITLDLQGFYALTPTVLLNANFYYLFNFQETNGVLIRNSTTTDFSCADQLAARVGVFYLNRSGLNAYLGGRVEAVPSTDLIGSSAGYRRPGYAISVEPGIGYGVRNMSFNLTVPIAFSRNRTQSFLDKQHTEQTGNYTHGDAAFADYLINFSFTYRFNKSHELPMLSHTE